MTSEKAQEPRAARGEAHVLFSRVASRIPVVEFEAAPEARHVVRGARVEEAVPRETDGIQRRALWHHGQQLLLPLRMFKRLDSSFDRDVLRVFRRRADVL